MDLLEGLNEAQKQAATHAKGPLLIVAGAGTGKTTVLTRRIAWLILEQKLPPREIVALTFTEKAAGEMEERIDQLLPLGYVDLNIGTFHGFCEQLLRAHGLDLGLPADFRVLDQTSAWILIRKNLNRFALDYYRPKGNPTKFIHALLQHFSRCKDELISSEAYLAFAEELRLNSDSPDFFERAGIIELMANADLTHKEKKELAGSEIQRITEIANAYHVYQQLLLDEGALDFGDLIFYTFRLLQERPVVRAHYQKLFKYILVDEFQDTNFAQYEIVKILAKPANNVTVVADDDQAIYRFRGASVSNILFFKNDFPDAAEIVLTHNYRSAQSILDASHSFIQANNPDRLEHKLETISKKLEAHGEAGEGIIQHLHFSTLDDEIKGVVDRIQELRNRSGSWNDCAILVRANTTAEPFVSELERREIPHQFLAASGLYVQPAVIDLTSYARVLLNRHDGSFLWRVLNMPVFDIPQTDIAALLATAQKKGWSLFTTLERAGSITTLSPAAQKTIIFLVGLIERHAAAAKRLNPHVIFLTFLNESGYLKQITRLSETKARPLMRDLEAFFKMVKLREQEIPQLDLRSFLELHEFALDAGDSGGRVFDPEEGPDMVRIMTVHGAKGLEFPYVFVVNMVDQRFPTRERKEPIPFPETLIKEALPEGDAHLQEERRLLYVAMTRAKKGVFFTSADDYGGARKKKKSRFLGELDISCRESVQDPSTSPRDDNPPVIPMREATPKKFSYSQLKAYQTCPLQYKFAHILRVPIKGRYTFSFGKTIHATLQQFFEAARTRNKKQQIDLFGHPVGNVAFDECAIVLPSEKDLLQMYERCWIDEWYESEAQRNEYHQRGAGALKKFYREAASNSPAILYLEKPFTVKISGEVIKGVIDRVDRVEGGVSIVDYKTGQTKTKEKMDKEQLLIYQLAMKRSFGEEVKNLTYYFIEDSEQVSFLGSDGDLDKLEEKILTTIDKIKSGDFSPTPGPQCAFCDFRDICDFRSV